MRERATGGLGVLVILALASAAGAVYAPPWLPAWQGMSSYTSQFWGLNGLGPDGDQEPPPPLAPDEYAVNDFGNPTAAWVTDSVGYVAWRHLPPAGTHPTWARGLYGGMAGWGQEGPYVLTATVPTGTETGPLTVFVQYDWYNSGLITPAVAGAADVTPAGYYDYRIFDLDRGYYRSTKVYAFADNPGSIDVTWTFATPPVGPPQAPMIDSFSITTAVNAPVPATMPIPEPTTLAVLVAGALGARRRGAVRSVR